MPRAKVSKALKQAIEKSSEFHGRPPKAIRRGSLRIPKAMIRIGNCAQIDYLSDKWDHKLRQYFHEFDNPPEIFATAAPGRKGEMMLVIVGKFKIEADGIIG